MKGINNPSGSSAQVLEISRRGKMVGLPALRAAGTTVIIKGKWLKSGEIFDEFWLRKKQLPDRLQVLAELRQGPLKADLFSFVERIPQTEPRYDFTRILENYAVIGVSSYEDWFRNAISPAARRNIAASEKRGVVVRTCEFDEGYVRGIMDIYNESRIRQGRKFWHYGKDYSAVWRENGTYAERSTFLAAYYQGEMIGYCKIVWDEDTAAIMQILSKLQHRDKRPNNALLAAAVRESSLRKVSYLVYEHFVYGNKATSSLTEFKRSNGFQRMDIPRYFIPLTLKGRIALRLGLHLNPKDRVPPWLRSWLVELRSRWHQLQADRRP